MNDLLMGLRSVEGEKKARRKEKSPCLVRFQCFLKMAGPKPSGPGLELSFMEKTTDRSSSREKGRAREEAWDEEREVGETRE